MGHYTFTEDEVETAALAWFAEMGYTVLYGPDIAPDGINPERDSYDQPLLTGRLQDAIARINPDLPQEALDEAFRKILRPASPSLVENNRTFHQYLTEGVTVEYRNRDGRIRSAPVRLLDTTTPENNEWLAVNQYTITENGRNRRPDIVVFVNGLPIAVIELKNPADPATDIWTAYNQLQTYKQQIPSLFATNELLVISDGVEARTGSLTAGREYFMPWRTVDGDTTASETTPELDVLIHGLFHPARLTEYLQDFILFQNGGTTFTKINAGYHQFFAVKAAIESTIRAASTGGDQKGGVIWHTQGSGKSLTMVFYARKLALARDLKNPTIVVLTDQNDLDDQLFDTFAECQDHLRQEPVQATCRANLRDLLRGRQAGGIVFSTVQKFFPTPEEANHPLLSDRRNIIFIADEAHESQYGFTGHVDKKTGHIRYGFAEYIRQALPNATAIGFTGTPISLKDRDTRQVFGNDISVYDVLQAQRDHVTVPIYYEGRHVKLDLPDEEKPKLDDELDDIVSEEDEETRGKIKSKWAALEAVVGTPHRIEIVAADIDRHFAQQQEVLPGKAMVVCMSRRICVEMYNALVRLHPEWDSDDDTTGAIKVIMSGTPGERLEWQKHIRTKQQIRGLRKRFKDPDDPFTIVIVRDMWNTGFNAPCLTTMYVDKPMQGHGLMQTIARVDRVFRDKPGGLVVDYLGIAPRMKKALAEYTGKKHTGLTVYELEEAVAMMLEKHQVCCDLMHGFDWSGWKSGDPMGRLALISGGMNHILKQPEGKEDFLDTVTQLSAAYALAVAHEAAEEIRDDVTFFQSVRASILKNTVRKGKPADVLDHAINQLISGAIALDGPVEIFKAAGLDKPDISILSDEFLAEVQGLPQKNLAVELLRKLINDEIKSRMRRNVVQSRKFSEMLDQTIQNYENRSVETAVIIEQLIETARQIREEARRGEKLGLSEAEIAFYDALANNQSAREVMADEDLRKIASELVVRIQENVTIDWSRKENVRARMRRTIKRILRRHNYPPDKQEEATQLVLLQAEQVCREISGEA
jgi:type I restriction enzyme R subunit